MKSLRIAPNALWRREGNGIVILEEITGEPYHLDEVGAFLFEYLRQARTYSQLVEHAQEAYEAPEEEIREDVRLFCESLLGLKLLEVVEDEADLPDPGGDVESEPR